MGGDARTIRTIVGYLNLKIAKAYPHTINDQKMKAIMAINLPALTPGEGPDGVSDLYRKK